MNTEIKPRTLRFFRSLFFACSAILLVLLALTLSNGNATTISALLERYVLFLPIGFFAATVANSTGAGGGIVFLPMFMTLGISYESTIATSFAIQCFGMTSGSFAWLILRAEEINTYKEHWQSFLKIMQVSAPATLLGLLFVQWGGITTGINVEVFFASFSILVAMAIFIRTYAFGKNHDGRTSPLQSSESLIIAISCFIGGAITAWLSVGVGEILAIVLVLMGFRVHLAIASAVCISSITAIGAIPYHLIVVESIDFRILLFAAPAALLGGAIAKTLATIIGIKPLKYFLATWIAVSGIFMLTTN